jgi:molybdopterin synthase sulfur carrier subunit
MDVKVKLLRPFNEMVGSQEITMSIDDGSNARDLLEAMAAKYPKFREGIHEEDGTLTDYLTFFVNDKPMSALKGLDTVLENGDEILMFMPVSGG